MSKKTKIEEIGEKLNELKKFASDNGISIVAIARDGETGESPQIVVGKLSDILAMIYGVFMGLSDGDEEKSKKLMHLMLVICDSGSVEVKDADKKK